MEKLNLVDILYNKVNLSNENRKVVIFDRQWDKREKLIVITPRLKAAQQQKKSF